MNWSSCSCGPSAGYRRSRPNCTVGRPKRPAQRGLWRAGCLANRHVRFGRRSGETGWPRGQYRAPGRPHSMSLHGAYPADDQDEDYPRSKHGHPKDRRYDLKQIQTGLAVTGDGGIPLLSRVIDGEAAEISQITGTMNALRTMAGPKEFLLIADSKLVSYRNITTLIKAGCDFIALAPAATVDDAVYARPHGRILQPSNNYTSPVARAASLIRQL